MGRGTVTVIKNKLLKEKGRLPGAPSHRSSGRNHATGTSNASRREMRKQQNKYAGKGHTGGMNASSSSAYRSDPSGQIGYSSHQSSQHRQNGRQCNNVVNYQKISHADVGGQESEFIESDHQNNSPRRKNNDDSQNNSSHSRQKQYASGDKQSS